MARLWIFLIVLLLLGWTGYAYITRDPTTDDQSGFDVNAANWPPAPADLIREVGANGQDPNSPQGAANRLKFATLFKNRYRSHTPMMAIGLRFARSGCINLMTPARMEPWNMDRLAVETLNEAQAAFGHPFDIDLFITYIGAPPIKIGELRPMPGVPGKVAIVRLSTPIVMVPYHRLGNHASSIGSKPLARR